MIGELRPYPTMKETGLPWLGRVPQHWEMKRLKNWAMNVTDQTNVRKSDDLYVALEHVEGWTGRLRLPPGETTFESQVKRFRPNDILFGKLRPYLAKVFQPQQSGVCVGEFLVLRRRTQSIDPAFLSNLLRSAPTIDFINSSTFGAKMPRADWDFIGNVEIAVPPLDEQHAIVRFLADFDRSVRRRVVAQQKLIKLLEEQKQAIIQRAVTRGLDPNTRLQPSGVEWLGDVPGQWVVRRLKTLFREVDSRTTTGTETLLSLRMYRGLVPHTDVSNIPIRSEALIGFKQCQPGQLVVNRMRAAIGMFGIVQQPGLVSPDYAVFSPREPINESFILYLFRTPAMRTVFRLESKGLGTGSSGFMRLYSDRFGIIKVAVPPLSEQEAIVQFLDSTLADINGGLDKANREIKLLTEYGTRLIAEVITGKLDVRAAAAALPPSSGEPEEAETTDISEEEPDEADEMGSEEAA